MKTLSDNSVASSSRPSSRVVKHKRNAIARRKLQNLHDEKVLRSWLEEVWEQSTWSDEFDKSRPLH
jgi:hypothetical protein